MWHHAHIYPNLILFITNATLFTIPSHTCYCIADTFRITVSHFVVYTEIILRTGWRKLIAPTHLWKHIICKIFYSDLVASSMKYNYYAKCKLKSSTFQRLKCLYVWIFTLSVMFCNSIRIELINCHNKWRKMRNNFV